MSEAARPPLSKDKTKGWFWYSGGPTTPGSCPAWGVKWIVMREPLEASLEQLNSLLLKVSGMDSTMMPQRRVGAAVVMFAAPNTGPMSWTFTRALETSSRFTLGQVWTTLHPLLSQIVQVRHRCKFCPDLLRIGGRGAPTDQTMLREQNMVKYSWSSCLECLCRDLCGEECFVFRTASPFVPSMCAFYSVSQRSAASVPPAPTHWPTT